MRLSIPILWFRIIGYLPTPKGSSWLESTGARRVFHWPLRVSRYLIIDFHWQACGCPYRHGREVCHHDAQGGNLDWKGHPREPWFSCPR